MDRTTSRGGKLPFLKRCGPFEAEERNGELSGERDSVGKVLNQSRYQAWLQKFNLV